MEGLRRHAAVVDQSRVLVEGVLEIFGLLGGQLRLVGLLNHFLDECIHVIVAAHFVIPADI